MHVKVIVARFPHFTPLFRYCDRGHIVYADSSFTWNGWNAKDICNYMILASKMERGNILRITHDFDGFVQRLRTVPFLTVGSPVSRL